MSDQLKPILDAAEGWQAEKHWDQRRYHYIRDQAALCRGLILYRGDLVPHAPGSPRGNEDCAACFRMLTRAKKAKP